MVSQKLLTKEAHNRIWRQQPSLHCFYPKSYMCLYVSGFVLVSSLGSEHEMIYLPWAPFQSNSYEPVLNFSTHSRQENGSFVKCSSPPIWTGLAIHPKLVFALTCPRCLLFTHTHTRTQVQQRSRFIPCLPCQGRVGHSCSFLSISRGWRRRGGFPCRASREPVGAFCRH